MHNMARKSDQEFCAFDVVRCHLSYGPPCTLFAFSLSRHLDPKHSERSTIQDAGKPLMPLLSVRLGLDLADPACYSPLPPHQKLALQLKAQFTNVTHLLPADPDHTLMLKLKCTSCHEEHAKLVGVTPSDEHEMTKGARGSANLVMSCSVSPGPPLPLPLTDGSLLTRCCLRLGSFARRRALRVSLCGYT